MDPTVTTEELRSFCNQWICERGNEDLTVDHISIAD